MVCAPGEPFVRRITERLRPCARRSGLRCLDPRQDRCSGAGCGEFLDRVYFDTFSTLTVGRYRYGLMLPRGTGFALDDGLTSRLGAHRFRALTTTTANRCASCDTWGSATGAMATARCQLVSVSDQWARYAVAGPRSRDVLAKLVDPPFDISNEASRAWVPASSPFAAACRHACSASRSQARWLTRSPCRRATATIRALMQAGAEFDITPYGTEALNVLRIEKGHVSGAEITGHVTARDLGLAGMVTADKDCIGKVLAQRPALVDPARPIVVGVKTVDPKQSLTAGSHFIPVGADAVTANDEGYLTSVAFSSVLGQDIGIGFLARGRERIGERIRAVDLLRGHDLECVVCSPVFYDAEGTRTHG